MYLFTKQKQTDRLREPTYGCQGRSAGGGTDWEFRAAKYTLLHLKQERSRDLLYSTGDSAQYSMRT